MDVTFLLDEHIDRVIATALQLRGHDAVTVADVELLAADDALAVLPFAREQSRVIVTRDTDFLALHAEGVPHAGIVHWPGKKRNTKEAIHYLLQLARAETAETMLGVVRYIASQYP